MRANKSLIWGASVAAALLIAAPAEARRDPECANLVEKPKKKVKLGGFFRALRVISTAEVGGRVARPLGVAATAASNANVDSVTVGGGTRCADTERAEAVDAEPAAVERTADDASPARPARKPRHPQEIPAPPELAGLKEAMDVLGKHHCSDCEGGFAYDSWVDLNLSDQLKGRELPDKISTMGVGESLHWKGEVANGTLTVVGADPVEGFDCRQASIRLKKGQQSLERPGLYCKGNFRWVEVY